MFEICPFCGKYSDEMFLTEDELVCPGCGGRRPFRKLPIFFLTGASGAGKSSAAQVLFQKQKDYVTVECDILWRDCFNTPEDGYADYRETWLRLAANITQYGKPVVLCGCVTPEQVMTRKRAKYFSGMYFVAVTNDSEEYLRHAKLRGFSEEHTRASLAFNNWLIENGKEHGIEIIDNTNLTSEETAEKVDAFVRRKLKEAGVLT